MRSKEFLAKVDADRIVRSIAAAESKTSGEIRVFVERGTVADALASARKRFAKLGMTATRERNGVLVFVVPRSKKFAIIGDEGIHQRCGDHFWRRLVDAMEGHLKRKNFTDALVHAIEQAGALLSEHFPRQAHDRNELPNEIEEG